MGKRQVVKVSKVLRTKEPKKWMNLEDIRNGYFNGNLRPLTQALGHKDAQSNNQSK